MSIIPSFTLAGILLMVHAIVVICLLRKKIFSRLPLMVYHVFSALWLFSVVLIIQLINKNIDVWLTCAALLFGVSIFFFIFGVIHKSLSLRFLLMAKSHGGQISLCSLGELITAISFGERAKILCDMGLVVKERNIYRLSEKGIRISKHILCLRKIFGIQTLGLY